MEPTTQQQFTNDTISFKEACKRESKVIKTFLDDYYKTSEKNINWENFEVVFLNTQLSLQRDLARILNLKVATLLGNFLGMPIFLGINKKCYWENLINSKKIKIGTWKGKWVSSTGRILMVKSVLSTILVYSMSCLKLPKAVEETLNQVFRKLFWSGTRVKKNPFGSLRQNLLSNGGKWSRTKATNNNEPNNGRKNGLGPICKRRTKLGKNTDKEVLGLG